MAEPNKNEQEDFSEVLLQYFLKVTIKDIDVMPQNIVYLQIKEWIFDTVPRLEMIIMDRGLWSDKYPLEEEDIITIQLGISKDEGAIVETSFKIMDFEIANTGGNQLFGSAVKITAYLESDNMFYPLITKAFPDVVSSDVIEQISQEVNLEPDIRIDTNDNMTWLQVDQSNNDMIHHILERSYKIDDTCIFCCADRDKNLILTSLKTELDKEVKFNALFDPHRSIRTGEQEVVNDGSDEVESLYYSNYKYKNFSGYINKMIGYGSRISYYDGNEEQTIDLISDEHPLSTNSNKVAANVGSIVYKESKGLQSINMHDNFMRAIGQNKYIKDEFFSNFMMITARPNINLKLFDKINLTLPSQDSITVDGVHSGEYIVGGIIHDAANKGLYQVSVFLFRNGINADEAFSEEFETKLS